MILLQFLLAFFVSLLFPSATVSIPIPADSSRNQATQAHLQPLPTPSMRAANRARNQHLKKAAAFGMIMSSSATLTGVGASVHTKQIFRGEYNKSPKDALPGLVAVAHGVMATCVSGKRCAHHLKQAVQAHRIAQDPEHAAIHYPRVHDHDM